MRINSAKSVVKVSNESACNIIIVICSLRAKKGGKTMRIDRFIKASLLAVVILLTILVVKPLFEAGHSYATKRVEYKVIALPGENLSKWEQQFMQLGNDGWELVGPLC